MLNAGMLVNINYLCRLIETNYANRTSNTNSGYGH